MSRLNAYTFVLWDENFDEMAATTFIIELRQAGLRVKLVGLTHRPMKGANGLALVPDLTLGQAMPLACRAKGVIIPCPWRAAQRLKVEPRLTDFFEQARRNQALFIIERGSDDEPLKPEQLFLSLAEVIVYPAAECLQEFIHKLVEELTEGKHRELVRLVN